MSDRYKQVKLYDNFKFYPECPVDILKGAIYIDNATGRAVFQLKLVNTQEKNIKALYVKVIGFNDLKEQLQNKEYSYLDLNIRKGQEFGTEQIKELEDNSIRNIDISINKIIYADNEVWENRNTIAYDRTAMQDIDKNLFFLASRKATENNLNIENIYYPTQNKDFWTCICGTYNPNNNKICYKCNCSKDIAFNQYNKEKLEEDLKKYNEQEIKNKELKKKKRKKLKNIILACIPFIIILAIIFYFWNIENKKISKYNEAVNKYNNKQFDEAITLFTELNDYKDSQEYINKANNGKEDLKTINKCISYYTKQAENLYQQCKTTGKYIDSNQVEQYIAELKRNNYYGIISATYSMRETYLKFIDELKTDIFNKEKETILKMDKVCTELYNFVKEYPMQKNYKEYLNEANKIYGEIEKLNKELENSNQEENKSKADTVFKIGNKYINTQGYITTNIDSSATELEGITVNDNRERLDTDLTLNLLKLRNALKNNELLDKVNKINVSDTENVKIYIENGQKIIEIGNFEDLTTKIINAKLIIEKEKGTKGQVIVKNKEQAIFRESLNN